MQKGQRTNATIGPWGLTDHRTAVYHNNGGRNLPNGRRRLTTGRQYQEVPPHPVTRPMSTWRFGRDAMASRYYFTICLLYDYLI